MTNNPSEEQTLTFFTDSSMEREPQHLSEGMGHANLDL